MISPEVEGRGKRRVSWGKSRVDGSRKGRPEAGLSSATLSMVQRSATYRHSREARGDLFAALDRRKVNVKVKAEPPAELGLLSVPSLGAEKLFKTRFIRPPDVDAVKREEHHH